MRFERSSSTVNSLIFYSLFAIFTHFVQFYSKSVSHTHVSNTRNDDIRSKANMKLVWEVMRAVSVYIYLRTVSYIFIGELCKNFIDLIYVCWFVWRCVCWCWCLFFLFTSAHSTLRVPRHSVSISFVFQSARIFLRKYISILILIYFVILKNELCCLKDKHRIFATLIYVKEVFKLTKCLESDFGVCIPLYVIILQIAFTFHMFWKFIRFVAEKKTFG